MSEIVVGLGTSHTPQMSSSAELWEGHAERDRRNPHLLFADGEFYRYDQLLERASPDISQELSLEVRRAKFARAQKAVEKLAGRLAEAAPDVVVIVGDDQRELFGDEGNPAVGLFLGEQLWDRGIDEERLSRMPPDIRPAQWAAHADHPDPYPVAAELSRHLAASLTEDDFEVTVFSAQRDAATLGHAFTFVRRRLGLPETTPIVPVLLNTYFPPNVPSPGRCLALGAAIRRGIASFRGDERVAVMASGGLSHFVVLEDFDRRVLDALGADDHEALSAIPRRYLRSGTSEVLNWITVAGMVSGCQMEMVDYIPGYRSQAGTGTGMGFVTWQP
jgi:3-O-methylgallate 3,4-dioxygenase